MTEHTIQSILTTTGLTEAELADLLEGSSLPSDRESALRASLTSHPEVARFFAGIRADRSTMRALDHSVAAPVGLLDAVEIRLEQEALRSLTEPAVPAGIAIAPPTMQIHRQSAIRDLLERTFVRRMAAAAGLLLAIGVGAWGTYVGIQNWPRGGPGGSGTNSGTGPIAKNDRPSDTLPRPADAGTGEVAIVSAEPLAPMYTVLAATSPMDGPGIAADGTVYSEPQLIDLASSGRLAIVISGDTRAMPERIARVGIDSRQFQIASFAQHAAATAMPSLGAAMERESLIPRAEWATALQGPWGMASATATGSRQYLNVVTPADPSHIRSLLGACGLFGEGSHIAGRSVRVIVLNEPIEQAPALDAASVLWWSTAPSKWVRTTTVPVIIEE